MWFLRNNRRIKFYMHFQVYVSLQLSNYHALYIKFDPLSKTFITFVVPVRCPSKVSRRIVSNGPFVPAEPLYILNLVKCLFVTEKISSQLAFQVR